jgi:phenylacetate-CoA ligase
MSFNNYIQERIALPLSDALSGKSIASSLKFLMISQDWPALKLKEFQDERLRLMIDHAYKNVPFYGDHFRNHNLVPGDIRNIEDLRKIPVITKADLRKNPPEYYLARNIPGRDMIRLNSSGSTGEPFPYYITREAFSMNYACALRGWYWMGFRLGDGYAKLSQNPRKGFTKKLQDLVTGSQYLFIRDLTPGNLKNVISELNRKKPMFIRCYPDPLQFLAKLILDGEKLNFTPKGINTTGNILTPDARAMIEKAFGAPVYDAYSCEASAQFFENPERTAYLASMEYAVTEVIDNEGKSVKTGRHITTDLWNQAMPFIRYDTQDVITCSDKDVVKPGGLHAFSGINGRNSDILLTPSGKFLIVHTFTIFFEYFAEILQFQVHQTSANNVMVFLKVNNDYSKETGAKVLAGLESLIGNDVQIDIEVVADIPLQPSGKRRFIIRDPSVTLPF